MRMLNNVIKTKQGFTLIEVIVSTAMFAILAIGITAMLVPTINVYRDSNEQADQMMILDYFQDELTSIITSGTTILGISPAAPTASIVVDGNTYSSEGGYYKINGQDPIGKEFYHGNFVTFEFMQVRPTPTSDDFVVQVTINLYEDSNENNILDISGAEPDEKVNERTFYVNAPVAKSL